MFIETSSHHRLYERARALLAPTLLFAPLHAFGSAARSVASCDLALKRYEDALSNLDLAEREASGEWTATLLLKQADQNACPLTREV